MDYLRHWSLREPPFSPTAARFYFLASPQRDATNWFQDVVSSSRKFGLLAARSGLGVSTLLSQLSKSSGFDDCAVEIVATEGNVSSEDDCLRKLAGAYGLHFKSHPELAIANQIDASRGRGLRTVWVIHQIGKHSDAVAARLAKTNRSLTVIASVTPMLSRLARRTIQQSLSNKDTSFYELRPLDRGETFRFIQHSLKLVDCRRELFSDSAKAKLYDQSGGAFRKLVLLGQQSMKLGARLGLTQIQSEHVELAAKILFANKAA